VGVAQKGGDQGAQSLGVRPGHRGSSVHLHLRPKRMRGFMVSKGEEKKRGRRGDPGLHSDDERVCLPDAKNKGTVENGRIEREYSSRRVGSETFPL